MKESEIIEGNKLIAEFMGQPLEYQSSQFAGKRPVELRYDSSWDWLLPAWKELREACAGLASDKNIEDVGDNADLRRAISNVEIEEAFAMIVGTLEWYNQNKKS